MDEKFGQCQPSMHTGLCDVVCIDLESISLRCVRSLVFQGGKSPIRVVFAISIAAALHLWVFDSISIESEYSLLTSFWEVNAWRIRVAQTRETRPHGFGLRRLDGGCL